MELHEEQRSQLDYYRRNRENRGRLAQVGAKFVSTGQGTYVFADDPVEFHLTFIEEPFMAHGCKMDLDVWEQSIDVTVDDDVAPMPSCTGYVIDWILDDRDYYIGAHVAVSVWFPIYDVDQVESTAPVSSQPVIEHYFTFQGKALKDVPTNLSDQ